MKTLSYGNKRCFFSHNHCTENQIFFFQTSWKDGLSKKIALEYDLSRIIGKDHVFLSRNMILTLGGKWKMIFFKKKNARKYDIFFRPPEKKVFSRKTALGHDLFCIIWKDGIFFPKTRYFFLGRKPATTFLKKYMEIWYFLCTRVGVTGLVSRPPAKKNQGWHYPAKLHLKANDVLDWHPGKSSSNSL